MTRTIRNISFCLLATAFWASCDEQTVTSHSDVNQVEVDSTKTTILNVSGKIFSVPSPIQTAVLIKNSGAAYERDSLNPTENRERYAAKTTQALNLGIYGTDMAYASLYNDGQTSLKYFKAVEDMAEKLEVKGAIDVSLLKRLGGNVGNADSLMLLSSQFYREADLYLKDNERLDIAALVLTGGWIESSYLTVLAAMEGNDDARVRLAEQKHTAKTIQEIIMSHCDTDLMDKRVLQGIDDLKNAFANVKSSYQYAPPETDAENKTTRVKSQSNYELSDAQFEELAQGFSNLRKNITK